MASKRRTTDTDDAPADGKPIDGAITAIKRFSAAATKVVGFNREIKKDKAEIGRFAQGLSKNVPPLLPSRLAYSDEHIAVVTELYDAAPGLLKILKANQRDAIAVFRFLREARNIPWSASWSDQEVQAALDDLLFQLSDRMPERPERLILQESNGRFIAILDNKHHALTVHQYKVLKILQDAKGGWVVLSAVKINKAPQGRPDKIIDRMPKEIQAIIDSKPGPGCGTRLVL